MEVNSPRKIVQIVGCCSRKLIAILDGIVC